MDSTKFDYIFIDGDHNYESVKKDVEDWLPKLKIDGYYPLHNIAIEFDGRQHIEPVADFFVSNFLKFADGVVKRTLKVIGVEKISWA